MTPNAQTRLCDFGDAVGRCDWSSDEALIGLEIRSGIWYYGQINEFDLNQTASGKPRAVDAMTALTKRVIHDEQ